VDRLKVEPFVNREPFCSARHDGHPVAVQCMGTTSMDSICVDVLGPACWRAPMMRAALAAKSAETVAAASHRPASGSAAIAVDACSTPVDRACAAVCGPHSDLGGNPVPDASMTPARRSCLCFSRNGGHSRSRSIFDVHPITGREQGACEVDFKAKHVRWRTYHSPLASYTFFVI
jgi:hypothetical protein